MQEIWKDIKGYEGLYQISNLGRIMSLARNGNINKNHILNKYYHHSGYQVVNLCKNNYRKNYRVHRLVAEAFIPNPNNLPQINHKDENKTNNCMDNLEWCDSKYNINYGNRIKKSSDKHSKPVCMFDKKDNYIKTYKSIVDAFEETGISKAHISSCCRKRYGRKTAGGYIWKYESEVI